MLASVYTDDEERGNAMGVALGGMAMGVLGQYGRTCPKNKLCTAVDQFPHVSYKDGVGGISTVINAWYKHL